MTGKDLILYILQNDLENEEMDIRWFLTESEVAVKFEVGLQTVRAWYALGLIPAFEIGGELYFLKNTQDPRKRSDI